MLNPLTSVVVYLTEMLISYIFLSNVSEKRFPSGRCLVIGAAVFGAACAGNLLLDNNMLSILLQRFWPTVLLLYFALRSAGLLPYSIRSFCVQSTLFGNLLQFL